MEIPTTKYTFEEFIHTDVCGPMSETSFQTGLFSTTQRRGFQRLWACCKHCKTKTKKSCTNSITAVLVFVVFIKIIDSYFLVKVTIFMEDVCYFYLQIKSTKVMHMPFFGYKIFLPEISSMYLYIVVKSGSSLSSEEFQIKLCLQQIFTNVICLTMTKIFYISI